MKRPSPAPEQILAARKQAKLSQSAAAKLVETDLRAWQQWEYGERKMHAGFWKLFCYLTSKQQWQAEYIGKSGEIFCIEITASESEIKQHTDLLNLQNIRRINNV